MYHVFEEANQVLCEELFMSQYFIYDSNFFLYSAYFIFHKSALFLGGVRRRGGNTGDKFVLLFIFYYYRCLDLR